MVRIQKYHSSDNYYMYNVEPRRIIISRGIKWEPITRLSFDEALYEVWRPEVNREIQKENA